MPVPGWDVPNNYYDSDMEEPLAEERIPMTIARDKALEEKPWKCSGCGAVAPDRVEACDCPTISLYRWSGEYMEHAIKKGIIYMTPLTSVRESSTLASSTTELSQ